MGYGYEWASMLKASACFGSVMSALILILFICIYYKRRNFRAIHVVASALSLILLTVSSFLLYQAMYSKERLTLDQVDLQIMHVVDLHQRVQFLLRTVPQTSGINDEKIKYALSLARDYLREIEQSITGIEELEFLNSVFQVENKENLTIAASIAYFYGGLLGLVLAVIITFLTSVYIVLRCYLDPTSTTNAGWLVTAAVFIAFAFVTSHDDYGSFNPVIVTLLVVAVIVGYLHVCIRYFPMIVLEISGCAILVLCGVLLGLSSWAVHIHGEDKLLAKLKAINANVPMIVSRAQFLGASLDKSSEMNDFDEGWKDSLIGSTYPIYYAVGGLEENLGNSIAESDDPAELHIYNPYKDEYETFEREYRRRLEIPIE